MPSKVLVIDDDPDLREIVTLKLELAGYEIHAEADGDAGLAAVRELKPDLVLLDWMMPRMTGIEVCRAMRDEEGMRSIPVVLLTAKAQVADMQRGFAAGADDYVVKPFSPSELLARVTATLARAA